MALQADLSQKRLGRAGKLTSLLGDELVRWQETVDELGDKLTLLVGDALISAACISYTGAFTGNSKEVLQHVTHSGGLLGHLLTWCCMRNQQHCCHCSEVG